MVTTSYKLFQINYIEDTNNWIFTISGVVYPSESLSLAKKKIDDYILGCNTEDYLWLAKLDFQFEKVRFTKDPVSPSILIRGPLNGTNDSIIKTKNYNLYLDTEENDALIKEIDLRQRILSDMRTGIKNLIAKLEKYKNQ